MAVQVEQEMGLVDDPVVQEYVSELGHRLVAASGEVPRGTEFRFRVVDAPDTVNAFALPGGYIYVTSGLLRDAESEAQLVGVLSHEIAHVNERHIAQQLVARYGLGTLSSLALGDSPGQLTQLVTQVAAQGALMKYGRDAERESDRLAVATMAQAGWSPYAYADYLRELARERGDRNGVLAFLQSHPDPGERAETVAALAQRLGPVPDRLGQARYQSVVRRLEARAPAGPPR